MPELSPTLDDVYAAAERIGPYIHRTPVFTSAAIDELVGAHVIFKCENLQKIGAFKIRGASNAVLSLSEYAVQSGVATHSSGNHAAALAQAARWRGIKATVVMPENAPAVKVAAVRGYGARVELCKPTLQARESTLASIVSETNASVVHPYNDVRVIAGQGTVALEMLEQATLDAIIVPVGGGGLLSGIALTTKPLKSGTLVYGAEPENVDDAYRSLQSGKLMPAPNATSIADGLLTALGDITFPIIRRDVAGIMTVSEVDIIAAMRLIWERLKLLVEPSAAVPLAALMVNSAQFAGKQVGIVLSGGNVDLDNLPW